MNEILNLTNQVLLLRLSNLDPKAEFRLHFNYVQMTVDILFYSIQVWL